jgi:hypothetical protein
MVKAGLAMRLPGYTGRESGYRNLLGGRAGSQAGWSRDVVAGGKVCESEGVAEDEGELTRDIGLPIVTCPHQPPRSLGDFLFYRLAPLKKILYANHS